MKLVNIQSENMRCFVSGDMLLQRNTKNRVIKSRFIKSFAAWRNLSLTLVEVSILFFIVGISPGAQFPPLDG